MQADVSSLLVKQKPGIDRELFRDSLNSLRKDKSTGFLVFSIDMRSVLSVIILGLLFAAMGCTRENTANNASSPPRRSSKPAGERSPVLVELFTSEGCGNCPPADKQLAFLETQQPVNGADVITLGYHVDYFNDRGWKDQYSSAEYTRRQNLYSMRLGAESMYTPQMIVDGRVQFNGGDGRKANESITKAAEASKPVVTVKATGRQAEVTITGFTQHTVATVVLAAAEDGLVSNVNAGNNKGKKLPHASVVRTLKPFGKVPEKATEFTGAVELPADPAWKAENVRYVVYVQEDQSGRIIAAGRVNIEK